MTVRFDEALDRAIAFARQHRPEFGGCVVIVRDLLGRIRFALGAPTEGAEALSGELHAVLARSARELRTSS